MLTSLNFLQVGQPWPPKGEEARLELYRDNKNLFEGKHELVFKDWVRILREDQQAALTLIFNWNKRLSTLWADLLLGEPPTITAGDQGSKEQDAVNRLIKENILFNVIYESVLDLSMSGTGIFKVRFENRGIIEGQPPSVWFPVVDPTNVKKVIAHVLAWTWTEEEFSWGNKTATKKYLQAEIHEKGKITTVKYLIDGSQISKALQLPPGIEEVVMTGVDDFLVVPFNNLLTTDRVTGIDDYSDLDGIVQELEIRVSQISRILDKHSDPNMYGPESALEWDPKTNQYSFKAGGKYFPCDPGDQQPGYLVWDGQLTAAFGEIDRLMEQLYFLSETSPAAFGQLKSGLAESGSALKRLMMAPLAKVNRLRLQVDPAVKKAVELAAALEVSQRMAGAVKLETINIDWQDGLPADEKEEHEIENSDFLAGTVSLETILKKRGLSGDNLQEELERIKGEQEANINPPRVTLPGAGGE